MATTKSTFTQAAFLLLSLFSVVAGKCNVPARSNEDLTVLKCNGGKLTLTCTQGVIQLRSAFYGFDQQHFCKNFKFVLSKILLKDAIAINFDGYLLAFVTGRLQIQLAQARHR